MTDFALLFQSEVVALFASDAEITNLIGANRIVDAPRRGQRPPFIVIKSHDFSPRNAVTSSLFDHEVELEFWHARTARELGFKVAERLVELFLNHQFGANFRVVRRRHRHTKTSIDGRTGWARTTIGLFATLEPTT